MLTIVREEEEINDAEDGNNPEELSRTAFHPTINDERILPGPEPFQHWVDRPEPAPPRRLLRGVVFGRSVRMSFCSIHVARLAPSEDSAVDTPGDVPNEIESREQNYNDGICHDNEEEDAVALIRMQFMGDNTIALRSYCRRFVKNGDLIEVVVSHSAQESERITPQRTPTAYWQPHTKDSPEDNTPPASVWQAPRLVVPVDSIEHAVAAVRVVQHRYWSMRRYQPWQRRYLPTAPAVVIPTESSAGASKALSHGCGLHKRTQGEYVANFLLHMIAQKLFGAGVNGENVPLSPDPSAWALLGIQSEGLRSCRREVISFLNRGSGVFDVAGGSGHVSMALGMLGVHSTVIDPRENAGKLPKRDRKIWQKSFKGTSELDLVKATPSSENYDDMAQPVYCLPTTVPFDTIRSFFGKPPTGIDTSYRHPDQQAMSFLDDERIRNCSAIVALHPDEATDAIVDTAVRLRIPFLIVPCCVFNRLFPNRRMPGRPDDPVSTHNDLLEYLQGKDRSIQKASFPFEGSNKVLWSIFLP
jgi:hypothetical protein